MRNKITKAARERAILICDVSASMPLPLPTQYQETYGVLASELGIDDQAALDLAYLVWSEVLDERTGDAKNLSRYWARAVDAEAAALLREGWNPGDPVVRR